MITNFKRFSLNVSKSFLFFVRVNVGWIIDNYMVHTHHVASETVHPHCRCYGSNNSLLAAAAATSVTNVLFKDHFPSCRAASGSIICVKLSKLIRE